METSTALWSVGTVLGVPQLIPDRPTRAGLHQRLRSSVLAGMIVVVDPRTQERQVRSTC